ncbi:MAG: hypothetical protein NUW37_10055 [Planctomycetes bacterium]|nr:hypothetical protein [Planctomycetota bacterium]
MKSVGPVISILLAMASQFACESPEWAEEASENEVQRSVPSWYSAVPMEENAILEIGRAPRVREEARSLSSAEADGRRKIGEMLRETLPAVFLKVEREGYEVRFRNQNANIAAASVAREVSERSAHLAMVIEKDYADPDGDGEEELLVLVRLGFADLERVTNEVASDMMEGFDDLHPENFKALGDALKECVRSGLGLELREVQRDSSTE